MCKTKYIKLIELNSLAYDNFVPNDIVNQFLDNSGTKDNYKYDVFCWEDKNIHQYFKSDVFEDCWNHHITIPIENMAVEDIRLHILTKISKGIFENGSWYVLNKKGKKVNVKYYRDKYWMPNWYYESNGERFYILLEEPLYRYISKIYHPLLPKEGILTPFDPYKIFSVIEKSDKLVIDWEDFIEEDAE